MTAWTDLVKKVYEEGKKKDSNYKLKDAMKAASKRKSEMNKTAAPSSKKKEAVAVEEE